MDRASKVVSGLSYDLMGQAGMLISGVLISASLARGLGPETFGKYVLVAVIAAAIGMLSDLGLTQAIARYAPELRASGKSHLLLRLVAQFLVVRVIAAYLLLTVLFAFRGPIGSLLGLEDVLTATVLS